MVAPPRTPESIRELLAMFGFAIALTFASWRFNWHLRGMAGKEDGPVVNRRRRPPSGPLSKSTLWIIALSTLGIFLFLAFICGVQRKQMGLPVF